ncbi:EAL domain-containing protein (putative c-di-GMP-specific phosphodiesterase class I)/GGDEF domain-containing protein [Oxalobacteraceae bacterium GrIS 2.11]
MYLNSKNFEEPSAQDLSRELDRIIANAAIKMLFQPIFSADSGSVIGWEALCRGPADSSLHLPLQLFDVAAANGRLIGLECLALKLALGRFKHLNLPGQLFLNVTVDSLIHSNQYHDYISEELVEVGIPSSRIVIELTESRPVNDPDALERAIAGLRSLGFIMAIDDLGEGFASLKRWVKMRPNFVKIDRHFIDGLHGDPVKQLFIRSIVEVAKGIGCAVIGEGVEDEADLQSLRHQGVDMVQGYLMAHPLQNPHTEIKPAIAKLLNDTRVSISASKKEQALWGSATCARNLAAQLTTVTSATTCNSAIKMFGADSQLNALPVLDHERRVIGVLRSNDVLRRGSEIFFNEVYGKRSCSVIMDMHPLVFDVSATLRTMSEVVANLNDRHLVDGYIVTEDGHYFGSGKMTDLLKAVSDVQIITARYANPLTLLPGNVPIDEHIKECLTSQKNFAAAYFDLDYFKAFNDVYGYRTGDNVIQLAARLLSDETDTALDFVGHIGGDDFVVVFRSEDWEAKVKKILLEFDRVVKNLFKDEHLTAGGFVTQNRQGVDVFHPLVSLSAGIVVVEPGAVETSFELSQQLAETKKMAKKMTGSSYFVDRRSSRKQVTEIEDDEKIFS